MIAKEDEEASQATKAYEKRLKLNSEFVNRWLEGYKPALAESGVIATPNSRRSA
jgi:hypothetical protein